MFNKLLKNSANEQDVMNEELTFVSFYRFLLQKKKTVLFIVSSIVIAVMLYSLIAPFQYRTGATVLPPENAGGMGDLTSFLQTLSGGVSLGGGGQANKLLIFREILKSREVSKIIVNKNNLEKKLKVKSENINDLYDGISNTLKVELKRSGLITISAETATPYFPNADDKREAAELSALIVNSSISALDSVNRAKNTTKARSKREFIEKMLARKKNELNYVDSVLEKFRTTHHLYALEEQNQALIGNAVDLGAKLAQAEVELNLLKLDYNADAPIIASAKNKYNKLLEQYQRVQSGGIASHDKFSIPLDSVPRLIRLYQGLIRKKKILEQVHLYLATQKYQEAIQEASDVPTVEPLDLAQVPKHRIAPKRKVMFFLAFFLSFVGAVLYILLQGIYRGNLIVKKEEKIKQKLNG